MDKKMKKIGKVKEEKGRETQGRSQKLEWKKQKKKRWKDLRKDKMTKVPFLKRLEDNSHPIRVSHVNQLNC
ncbi:Uncharacterized protein TCM_033515 [Theobroma cacao]|uniref:Uncharacterized protein n=1 Tax=Theobroma cacao TaxID=3641 RepID=A0A061FID8_THECC|nr:Uncharacterized protein TCM_033515 [Theobroma cacao]